MTDTSYRHFGPIHRHPTSGNVKGYPEFHVVYRDAQHDRFREYAGANRANHTQWHSDVSYELQPPGTTFFFILDQPEIGGGDTLFLSQVEAYKRLSPEFQKRLEGLRALHTAVPQAEFSRKRNGPVRREPVETEVRCRSVKINCSLISLSSVLVAPPRPRPPRHWREGPICEPRIHEVYCWLPPGGVRLPAQFPL